MREKRSAQISSNLSQLGGGRSCSFVGIRHVSGFRPAWLFVTDGSPRCWSGVCLPRPGQKSFPDRTLQEPSQLHSCTLELNNHLINLRYCSKEDLG